MDADGAARDQASDFLFRHATLCFGKRVARCFKERVREQALGPLFRAESEGSPRLSA